MTLLFALLRLPARRRARIPSRSLDPATVKQHREKSKKSKKIKIIRKGKKEKKKKIRKMKKIKFRIEERDVNSDIYQRK